MVRRRDRVFAVLVATAVAALGWSRSRREHFWWDEAFTAGVARQPLTSVVRILRHEAGHGPFYLALWAWRHVTLSESGLRLLSVAGGAVLAYLVVRFAQTYFGDMTAIFAGLLLLSNPTFAYYLVELRAYSWVMALGLASSMLLLGFLKTPSRAMALAYGLVLGLCLASLPFSWGLALVHGGLLLALLRSRGTRHLVFFAGVVCAVVVAPFLPALVGNSQLFGHAADLRFVVVQSLDSVGGLGHGLGLLVVCLWVVDSAARLASGWSRSSTAGKLVTLTPPIVAVCFGVLAFIRPIFAGRYMLVLLPFALVGAASGAVTIATWLSSHIRIGGRVAKGLVFGMVGLALLAPAVGVRVRARSQDLAVPAREVLLAAERSDEIRFDTNLVRMSLVYYEPKLSGVGSIFGLPWNERFNRWFSSRACSSLFVAALASEAQLAARLREARPAGDFLVREFKGATLVQVAPTRPCA
jgi:hypothetical protein